MSNLKITKIDLKTNYPELDKFMESDKFKKIYAQENLMLRIRINNPTIPQILEFLQKPVKYELIGEHYNQESKVYI